MIWIINNADYFYFYFFFKERFSILGHIIFGDKKMHTNYVDYDIENRNSAFDVDLIKETLMRRSYYIS